MRGANTDTKKISREHAVVVSNSGLVTIVGGKWTTYRKMAEKVVDLALDRHRADQRTALVRAV